uniref:Integrase catalytic domain-containing protein n=1 Tax=Tanacetum cinerariifolium TaxID=118510 RepID=A0A6L2LW33_TANCI|nr:hypothetical protein [Tanacetum cinerariifolium]
MNLKLLRSLPSEWKTHALIWRNKAHIETISLNNLYNNLKIYEPKLIRSSSTSQNPQNVAFVSSNSTNSTINTNEADNTAFGVSTAHSQGNTINSSSVDNLNDAVICAFLASQPNSPQLTREDLEQINPDDLEEMDLHWEMAMLTIRARSDVKTVESKHKSVDVKNKGVNNTIETKPVRKNSFSPPIIKDWNSDDESEVEFEPKVEVITIKPSIEKIKFIKPARHMIRNKCYLTDYEDYDGGFVSFRDGKGRISGKVKIKTRTLDFDDVYFCKELKYNLFKIKREFSIARTPQQNGVAKRKNKTLIEAARTMLLDSELLTTFWAKAVNTACYVKNKALVIKPHNKTPYELIRGRPPLIDFMKPFGKAIRVFNKRTRIVEETLNIRFLENAPHVKGNGLDWLFDIDSLIISMNYEPVVVGKQTNAVEEEVDINNVVSSYTIPDASLTKFLKDHPKDQVIGIIKTPVQTRQMTKINEEHDKWGISTKWVFRNKKDERGIVVKNKARLVTQGHTQEEGINYDEVFAPVARIEAIRLFLAYASFKDFVVYQMDVKSAFLYGKIKEEVYVCQPPCFEDLDFSDKVYKVEKALYGLHQASRTCQDKYVADILTKFDFSTMKTASTSMEPNKALVKDSEAKDVDVHLYRSMIGSLMYLTASRPDITFAVCACASLDMKSTTGGCQFLGKRLISWQCKKQTIVANSTTEAEYVAAANCYRHVLWIQNQMLNYGFNFLNTKIYIDNENDTVYKEWEDIMERATTTASSLEVEKESGNIHRTQFMATLNEPLPQGIGSGSQSHPSFLLKKRGFSLSWGKELVEGERTITQGILRCVAGEKERKRCTGFLGGKAEGCTVL